MSDIQLNLTHGPERTGELKIRHRGNRVNNICLLGDRTVCAEL